MPFIYQLVISFVGKGACCDREVSRRKALSTFRFYHGNGGIPAETQEIYGTHLLLANKGIYFFFIPDEGFLECQKGATRTYRPSVE